MMGFGMGFGFIGLLLMILFWGGLILLAIWLVRSIFQGSNQSAQHSTDRSVTARQILDERYARGEITREQYELMRQDID